MIFSWHYHKKFVHLHLPCTFHCSGIRVAEGIVQLKTKEAKEVEYKEVKETNKEVV